MDGSQCRNEADAWAELARQVQGQERSLILDIADEWDALAEQNDELERNGAAHIGSTAEKNAPRAARPVLHP